MKQVAVILSGCGYLDGTEIYESVLTILALERAGVQIQFFAPDRPQARVMNHFTGQPTAENRNVLTEAARIVRGKVLPLSQADALLLDALIVPGGFGVALNLSDFAEKGAECSVDSDLLRLVRDMHAAGKPQGFICIAPALLPKLLSPGIRLTIGNDIDIIDVIEQMGGEHVVCPVDDIVVDDEYKVVTTPAFMLANSASEAAQGIDKLVERVLALCE